MKFRRMIPYLIVIAAVIAIFIGYNLWRDAVNDAKAPIISVAEGVLEISVNDPSEAMLQGITARDDRDGDVTDSILIEKIGNINDNDEVTVTYCAFDKAGNVSKIRRTVRYKDYESPRFSLSQPLLYPYGRDVDIVNRVTAVDCIDGDISHKIKPTLVSEIPVSSEGIHQILFRVANSYGDTVEVQLPAEIYPSGKYNALLYLQEYLVYIPVGEAFRPEAYLKDFHYSDNLVSLVNSLPEGYRVVVDGKVDTQTPGVYPVSYTVTYETPTYQYSAYSKLIVIVEG